MKLTEKGLLEQFIKDEEPKKVWGYSLILSNGGAIAKKLRDIEPTEFYIKPMEKFWEIAKELNYNFNALKLHNYYRLGLWSVNKNGTIGKKYTKFYANNGNRYGLGDMVEIFDSKEECVEEYKKVVKEIMKEVQKEQKRDCSRYASELKRLKEKLQQGG